MEQKLIFLDIDGTLLPPGDMLVPESTLQSLYRAKANGHKLFLCTGRNYRMTEPLLRHDCFAGAECSAGGYVLCDGKVLVDIPMEPQQAAGVRAALERHGVECTTCQSVKEAVLALDRLDYDLVLTDIQMPVTDGFGLLKLLRGSDIGNSRTIPVAVMTARGDGDSGVYARSGFCGCIHKPFSSKGLLAFLSSVMAGRAAGASPFDYSRLMESTDDRRHMFGLVMKESEKELAELEGAMEGMDREAMRRTVHRMAPVWELLGAGDVLSDYRKILHDKAAGDETVRGHTLRVMEQIRTLMDEMNNELEKRDDGNEKDLTGRGG